MNAVSAETNEEGTRISLYFNKHVDPSSISSPSGFSLTANGSPVSINAIEADPANPQRAFLYTTQALSETDVLLLHYNEDLLLSVDGTALADFSNLPVKNNLLFHFLIPTKIEAEAFIFNQGLQLENTTDTGGGQNLGYTNPGDYVDYRIRVPYTGVYPVDLRIACKDKAGKLELQQLSEDGSAILNSVQVNIPITGDWQIWQTVQVNMELDAGKSKLRVLILQPEFNINWYRFLDPILIKTEDLKQAGKLLLYPNPAGDQVYLEIPEGVNTNDTRVSIRNLYGQASSEYLAMSGTGTVRSLSVQHLPAGIYLVELESEGRKWIGKLLR